MRPLLFVKKMILCPKKCSVNFTRLKQDEMQNNHKVNNLDRKFLVWTGKYKTVKDVPIYVGQSTMEKARNRMRIKIANYMIVATVIGCILMVVTGKQAAKRGESVQKQNLEWHRQYNEESKKK